MISESGKKEDRIAGNAVQVHDLLKKAVKETTIQIRDAKRKKQDQLVLELLGRKSALEIAAAALDGNMVDLKLLAK